MMYPDYKQLTFERRENGVLLITLNRPEKYNAVDEGMHGELARVWTDISADPQTRVAVVTGAGKAFSAGGDLEMVQRMAGNYDQVASMLTEMSDLVYPRGWVNVLRREKSGKRARWELSTDASLHSSSSKTSICLERSRVC